MSTCYDMVARTDSMTAVRGCCCLPIPPFAAAIKLHKENAWGKKENVEAHTIGFKYPLRYSSV